MIVHADKTGRVCSPTARLVLSTRTSICRHVRGMRPLSKPDLVRNVDIPPECLRGSLQPCSNAPPSRGHGHVDTCSVPVYEPSSVSPTSTAPQNDVRKQGVCAASQPRKPHFSLTGRINRASRNIDRSNACTLPWTLRFCLVAARRMCGRQRVYLPAEC